MTKRSSTAREINVDRQDGSNVRNRVLQVYLKDRISRFKIVLFTAAEIVNFHILPLCRWHLNSNSGSHL